MHANVVAQDLMTRKKNGVERYTFVFNTLCQQRKVNREGGNQKNDPPTLVADPFIRKKGSKWIWVKKEEVKDKVPLPMCSREEAQTGAKKKMERNASVRT